MTDEEEDQEKSISCAAKPKLVRIQIIFTNLTLLLTTLVQDKTQKKIERILSVDYDPKSETFHHALLKYNAINVHTYAFELF